MAVRAGTLAVSPKRPKLRFCSGTIVRTAGTGIVGVLLPKNKRIRTGASRTGTVRSHWAASNHRAGSAQGRRLVFKESFKDAGIVGGGTPRGTTPDGPVRRGFDAGSPTGLFQRL